MTAQSKIHTWHLRLPLILIGIVDLVSIVWLYGFVIVYFVILTLALGLSEVLVGFFLQERSSRRGIWRMLSCV